MLKCFRVIQVVLQSDVLSFVKQRTYYINFSLILPLKVSHWNWVQRRLDYIFTLKKYLYYHVQRIIMVCIFCIEAGQWWSILKYILPFNFSILKKVLFIIASVCRLIKSETISTNKGPTPMRHMSRDSVWLDVIFGVK